MGEADDKMLKAIKHYQDSLERNTKTGKSEKLLHAIGKLSLLPIRVWHLEETGVGRTVNGLKKFEGTVGEQARNLVDKWKFMVKGEEEKEEKEQNELKAIKIEKIDSAPVQEPPQRPTRETKCDDDKRNYHSSNRSKSRSSPSNSQSSRHCDQPKATNSKDEGHKRHHSKITDYKSSSSDSEASKRSKVIKAEVKQKHSKYSDKSSESESDDSDSSNQSPSRGTQCESSPARSSSGSSDNSSSDSSGSSSSDEDDSDSNCTKERHTSHDSDSDSYSYKKSSDSRSEKQSKSSGTNSEYSKIDNSKKKIKNNDLDSSEANGTSSKHREQLDKDVKQSTSKKNESRSRHHNSKSESSKSKHTSEKNKERESKSSSSDYKKSEHREQDKSKDRGSHRSTKLSKSEDNKKNESNKEKSHKEKKDDKSETTRKRSREESSSRENKKLKTSSDTNDSRRSHDHSSSSKKDRDKHSVKDEKQKETCKESKDKKTKDRSSTSSESKSSKIPKKLMDGIDSGSGTSFADVLGMLEAPVYSKSKKKTAANDETIPYSSKETSSVPKEDKTARSNKPISESRSSKADGEIPNLLKDPAGLDPLDINISSLLPSITPNYRPLGVTLESSRPMYMDDEAFSKVITAKHQRTKVYSGNKAGFTKVPTLFDLCSRILQDNLDALEYTGGVPYSILKPILEKANPNQLYMLEFHNPYLIEDTDELWQLHCQKEFRNKKREELESWREMYLRCLDEREAKLKALTANIKQSQDKSIPVRQTKLAYVDSVVKPPRNIARKQMKNGLAIDIKKPSQTPTERLNQLAKSGEAAKIAVPNPSRMAVERSSSSSSHIKPKKAPLMAKTLSLLKNRFGRR